MKRAKSYIQSITIGEEFIEIKYYQNSTMKQINCRKIDLVIVFYPEFKSKGYWEIYEHGKLKLLQHEAFFDSDTDIIELFDAISKYMPSDSMVDKSRIH
ncbi:hypothetical protein [Reichenbachiella agariperforans]|nr:hypothetical protein [Reichenbachiella agariperforans]